jgi:hypothetical protein
MLHWGLILRNFVYVVLPLVAFFVILQRIIGEITAATVFIILALALPFVAVGWLAWQHFRHRKGK